MLANCLDEFQVGFGNEPGQRGLVFKYQHVTLFEFVTAFGAFDAVVGFLLGRTLLRHFQPGL